MGPKFGNQNNINRKDNDLILKISNSFSNKGISSMSAKNKYYKQQLPSLPVSQINTGKKSYRCNNLSWDTFGKVMAFGLHSTNGAVRPYNEDRVVEFHTTLTDSAGPDVKFSFFAVYDGHGGSQCSKFLTKELHAALVDDENLIRNPVVTIRKHIFQMDNKFLQFYLENPASAEYQRAGSCLNIVVILDDIWYVANVGDCRSIMSTEGGRVVYQLSKDHKPSDPDERDRVIDAGGKIYVSSIKQTQGTAGLSLQRTDKLINKTDNITGSTEDAINVIENGGEAFGPHRVIPGRLSVSRALGDAHAKFKQLGGNENVVIARPDIKKFRLDETYDFIIMGSDGLFDKQTNSEIVKSVFKHSIDLFTNETKNINRIALSWCEQLVKEAMDKRTLDNISWNMIMFENFINSLNGNALTSFSEPPQSQLKKFDLSFTPKKSLPPLSKHKDIIKTNYDLNDDDVDKTHSSKVIEYMIGTMKPIDVARNNEENDQNIGTKQNLFYKSQNQNITPSKDLDRLKYSYRLPSVGEKSKLPYVKSFANTNELKTIQTKNAYNIAVGSRHHTQPRMQTKPFTFTNDYNIGKKGYKVRYL